MLVAFVLSIDNVRRCVFVTVIVSGARIVNAIVMVICYVHGYCLWYGCC